MLPWILIDLCFVVLSALFFFPVWCAPALVVLAPFAEAFVPVQFPFVRSSRFFQALLGMLFVHLMFPFDFALFFLPLSLATIGDASPFVHVSFVRLPFVMPFFSSSFLFAELVLSYFFFLFRLCWFSLSVDFCFPILFRCYLSCSYLFPLFFSRCEGPYFKVCLCGLVFPSGLRAHASLFSLCHCVHFFRFSPLCCFLCSGSLFRCLFLPLRFILWCCTLFDLFNLAIASWFCRFCPLFRVLRPSPYPQFGRPSLSYCKLHPALFSFLSLRLCFCMR